MGKAKVDTVRQWISTVLSCNGKVAIRFAKEWSGFAMEMKRDEERSNGSEMKRTVLCRMS